MKIAKAVCKSYSLPGCELHINLDVILAIVCCRDTNVAICMGAICITAVVALVIAIVALILANLL